MKFVVKKLALCSLIVATTGAIAAPSHLITHNNTDVESNAWVNGKVKSTHPTPAHTTNKVAWPEVKMVCFGQTKNNICSALIKMGTNTANPVVLGTVNMDLGSGDITPKEITANGYKMVVNGPGETTLNKAE